MYRDRAIPFFLKLGIPKLDDLVLFEKAIFVFKLVIKSLSLHLDNCSIWCTLSSFQKSTCTKATHRKNYFILLLKTSKTLRSIK